MLDAAPTPEPTRSDPLREWTAQHLSALSELVEIGMDFARMMREQAQKAAQSDAGAPEIGELGVKFARVARAVRQTVALGSKLADDLDGLSDRADNRRAAEGRARDARLLVERKARGAERKAKAADLFERAVDCETPQSDREDLLGDLVEWRADARFDETFADLPITEIFNAICRDLGVAPDWSRLTAEALARIEVRPSLKTKAFATWPPAKATGAFDPPDPGDPRPPPAQSPPRSSGKYDVN